MQWLYRRLNPIQRRAIVLAVALEVAAIVAFGVFSAISASPSMQAPTGEAAVRLPCEDAAQAANPIAVENTCPGTSSWLPDLPFGSENSNSQHSIEAFAAPVSVNAGERVKLYVSTSAPYFEVHVYRMGWYQGLGGRLIYSSPWVPGIVQPSPIIDPATRMVSASNWRDSLTITVPTSWVSGIYVDKLVSSIGHMRYTFFVVRNDASHAPILFQSSVLTDQAYNLWGGRSLYRDDSGAAAQRSYAVSLDRPYQGAGLSFFPLYEFNLQRWLEQHGYNMTYSTDVDTDQRPSLLLNHRLFLAAGHDEYWSTAMRQNVVTARDAGVSLAFFGADDIGWHVRLQDSPLGRDRVVVCYKDAALDPMSTGDPSAVTVSWRDAPLNQPEDAVMGGMFAGIVHGGAPLVFTGDATPFFQGTALKAGSSLPGLVAQDQISSEVDNVVAGSGAYPTLKILASSPVRLSASASEVNGDSTTDVSAMVTVYTAPSGARVFDAGTYWWGLGLDDFDFRFDPDFRGFPRVATGSYSSDDFQRFTTNLLAYLVGSSGGKA